MITGEVLSKNPVVKHQEVERVLILTVTAGEGHTRAAIAVKEQLIKNNPAAQVKILDTFRYASPRLEKLVLGSYIEVIKISPALYKYLYKQSEKGQPLGGFAKAEFAKIMTRLVAPKLLALIDIVDPQIILCTHPFPLGILSNLKEKGQLTVPVMAAITDFTVHSYWVYPRVDYYCVANEQLIPKFVDFGYDYRKVSATGIPIDSSFSVNDGKEFYREQLGLNTQLPIILISGGGLGIGPLEEAVKVLSSRTDCQLIVVCGRNTTLKDKINKLANKIIGNIKVYGFVNNMHQLMKAADLMITKAGGLTCSEALAVGLPLLIVDPIPGQEERNTEFLVSQGAAVNVKNHKQLLVEINRCLQHKQYLNELTVASTTTGRPEAAQAVVALMKELIQGGQDGDHS
jgi:processive 1,2-diacylglycerol beta-glucosyltransferase